MLTRAAAPAAADEGRRPRVLISVVSFVVERLVARNEALLVDDIGIVIKTTTKEDGEEP